MSVSKSSRAGAAVSVDLTMASARFSEDELGRRWDRCLTDGVLKLGGGALVGTVLSLLFFKRRKWPIIMGSGFGIGMAYKNCENQLNETVACRKRTA